MLPIINVFHFYYLLWGEASEGVSGGEGQGVRGKRRVDGEEAREGKIEKVEKALGERERETASAFSCLWGS